jgi:hypothetical protein
MEERNSGEAMAALAEATAIQTEVTYQRLAFMWAQMVFAPLLKAWRHMEDHETLAYEDKVGAQVGLLQQTSTNLGRVQNFACHAVQGVCAGAIVVAEQRRGDVTLVIRPGTQIRRGEQALTLRELELGAPIKAFAFRMSGDQLPRVVLIEVTDVRQPLTTP